MRELMLCLVLAAALGGILVPFPPLAIDTLVAANVILSGLLLLTALHVPSALRLSSLPSILLLTALFRLALNVSTSRAILTNGHAGQIIEAFGRLVMQGSVLIGLVLFLMLAIVQILVVAKGSERVAEVAARFSLDALPGKQMSIDADVRAGLLDAESARRKRDELQLESRFYGALDGAMKFVKGDAIVGLVVAVINGIGGLVSGLAVHGHDLATALQIYTRLTIGDGLASQIPSLLNAVAAGLIVTKVQGERGRSVARQVMDELFQHRSGMIPLGLGVALLGFVPGAPLGLCLVLGAASCAGAFVGTSSAREPAPVSPPKFEPSLPAPIEIRLDGDLHEKIWKGSGDKILESIRKRMFGELGVLLPRAEVLVAESPAKGVRVIVHGFGAGEGSPTPDGLESFLFSTLRQRAHELLDDAQVRKLVEILEAEHPEISSAVIPALVTLTQFTELLRALLREEVSVQRLDVILQSVAQAAQKTKSDRALLEEVRAGIGRLICSAVGADAATELRVLGIDPFTDLALTRAERGQGGIEPGEIERLTVWISERVEPAAARAVLVSKGARRLLLEGLEMKRIRVPVVAYEEVCDDCRVRVVDSYVGVGMAGDGMEVIEQLKIAA